MGNKWNMESGISKKGKINGRQKRITAGNAAISCTWSQYQSHITLAIRVYVPGNI
jgi:hypothetical protein